MAQVVLAGDELVNILHANELIPNQVTGIEVNGEEIKVKVRTDWPVLKSVRVGVKFAGFSDGQVVLQLVTNRLIDKFDWLVDRIIESLPVEDHAGRWEYPRLYVNVNRLMENRLRGVQIEGMAFRDGHFHITTAHRAVGGNGHLDAAGGLDVGGPAEG
jgi:hypothetical protein